MKKLSIKLNSHLLAILLLLNGCTLFVSHYSATSYEYFTKLKAFHLKFLDDYTEGEGKSWSEKNLQKTFDQGDLKFKEALEFARGKIKKDTTRVKAFIILYEEFKANCSFLKKKKRFFKKAFVKEIRYEIEKNYNYAIKGEFSRVGSRQ